MTLFSPGLNENDIAYCIMGAEMAGKLPSVTLKAIGIIRNEIREAVPLDSRDWGKIVSEIVIDSSLAEALDGLEEFSHIVVLYWMHRAASGEVPLKIHPRGNRELPLMGLFATRAPNRPNRIGETTVRLLQRQGNILRVKGLDALDGTPVIDIKPYIPGYDSVDKAEVPQWIKNQ
ncbi:tRNA (N6-threonylcarbamoyladenosine(37)-N6)-methyltransferase TrmO [Chloroflexota bacterium]